MSTFDELTTQCLQLLHSAGLAQAEAIRPLSRQTLSDRLAEAGGRLGISSGVSLDELIDKIQRAAENRWAGELTYTDFGDLGQLPGSATRSLPGYDDSPVWGRDRDLDDDSSLGLPGDDDFNPWGDNNDEDKPER